MNHDDRRIRAALVREAGLRTAAAGARGLLALDGLEEGSRELGRRNLAVGRGVGLVNCLHEVIEAVSLEGRDADHAGPAQEVQLALELEVEHLAVVVGHEVPLVDGDDEGAA